MALLRGMAIRQSKALPNIRQADFPSLFNVHQSLDDTPQEDLLFRLCLVIAQRFHNGNPPPRLVKGQADESCRPD